MTDHSIRQAIANVIPEHIFMDLSFEECSPAEQKAFLRCADAILALPTASDADERAKELATLGGEPSELLKHWQRAAAKLQNDLRTSGGFDTRESRMVDKALANVRQKTELAIAAAAPDWKQDQAETSSPQPVTKASHD
jgi:hypothetical protein